MLNLNIWDVDVMLFSRFKIQLTVLYFWNNEYFTCSYPRGIANIAAIIQSKAMVFLARAIVHLPWATRGLQIA